MSCVQRARFRSEMESVLMTYTNQAPLTQLCCWPLQHGRQVQQHCLQQISAAYYAHGGEHMHTIRPMQTRCLDSSAQLFCKVTRREVVEIMHTIFGASKNYANTQT